LLLGGQFLRDVGGWQDELRDGGQFLDVPLQAERRRADMRRERKRAGQQREPKAQKRAGAGKMNQGAGATGFHEGWEQRVSAESSAGQGSGRARSTGAEVPESMVPQEGYSYSKSRTWKLSR